MANRAAPGLPASRLRPGGRAFQQAGGPQGGIGPGAPAVADATTGPPGGSLSPSLASLQMRGGLGKTLLLAFLLLAIVPLSFLAFVTHHEVQRYIEEGLLTSLETIVSLQQAHLVDWVEARHRALGLAAAALDGPGAGAGPERWQAELEARLPALQPDLSALVLVDGATGRVLATTDPQGLGASGPEAGAEGGLDPRHLLGPGLMVTAGQSAEGGPAIRYAWGGKVLLGVTSWEALGAILSSPAPGVEGLHVHLVTAGGLVLAAEGGPAYLPAGDLAPAEGETAAAGRGDELTLEALLQSPGGAGAYRDAEGLPVFGAYRWLPELELGILAEQPQERVVARGDAATALIVGATLAVALLTAAIAAVVTRRITRPIVQLTATASWMARGDLSRRVEVARRDEIGLLAGAFNHMAAELQILYANLEARVAERTAQLAAANEQARYHARQLAISAQVAGVASSIRDLPALLSTVVELIGRSFELEQVAIYLLRQPALLAAAEAKGAAASDLALWQAGSGGRLTVGGRPPAGLPALVEAALATAPGEGESAGPVSPLPGPAEMAVPLQVCGRTLGVLHVTGRGAPGFRENDALIYRSLADQIAIAIENASAYALEHETVRHLRELDRIQSRFLTNMSHALRTPLNSILGFSRVMLKGLDGSLNELQRADLATIHEGGRQLLGLIDDLLELSQWDIAPFDPDQVLPLAEGEERALAGGDEPALSASQVDLAEIVEGVMATASALARGKPLGLQQQVPADLPAITTDGRAIRRLILALLANAVKFTAEGQIWLAVTAAGDRVTIAVGARGRQEPGQEPGAEGQAGAPAAPWLRQAQRAIARRSVERLGGEIVAEGAAGQEEPGLAFGFSLPVAGTGAAATPETPGGRI